MEAWPGNKRTVFNNVKDHKSFWKFKRIEFLMLENTNGQSISNALVYFRWKHSYFDSKMTHFESIIAYWTIFGIFRENWNRNSDSKIFVKFSWPVLIENWTGLHRFKRSCYLPCLTNNSRFLMNADVVKFPASKIWNFWKFPRWFELEKILEGRFETKHQNLAIRE